MTDNLQGSSPPKVPFSEADSLKIDLEISRLQDKRIIEEAAHESGEFISNIFFRVKKNGDIGLILNLRLLNKAVQYYHFKMETINAAIHMMTRGCYMASVDLKDAYYSIPVCRHYRKYLRFRWRGSLYQFTCLPHGLSEAQENLPTYLKSLSLTLGLNVTKILLILITVHSWHPLISHARTISRTQCPCWTS